MPRSMSSIAGDTSQSSLKRNQACHQCRKRKQKCDAARPACTTCIRLHASTSGSSSQVSCTYDDPNRPRPPPKSRFHVLETRVVQLEDLLRQNGILPPPASPMEAGTYSFTLESPSFSAAPGTAPSPSGSPMLLGSPNASSSPYNLSPPLPPFAAADGTLMLSNTTSLSVDPDDIFADMIRAGWPRNLPSPDVLTQLVQAFFAYCPGATSALHCESFLLGIALPPTSPEFPNIAVLHAMCSFGSLYWMPDPSQHSSKGSRQAHLKGSFGEMHGKWASEAAQDAFNSGKGTPDAVLALWVLTRYYYSQSKHTELAAVSALAIRYATFLGSHYASLPEWPKRVTWDPPRQGSPPPASDPIDTERRRNVFWHAYAMDKFLAISSNSPCCIGDDDITQLLPQRLADTEAGKSVSESRQSMTTPTLLVEHPPHTTDSFVLYVKSAILLSRLRTFQVINAGYSQQMPDLSSMEHVIRSFSNGFPLNLRQPVQGGHVDSLLYIANLVPHIAMILLHNNYIDARPPNMPSLNRVVEATNAVINSISPLFSIHYDLSTLDHITALFWFITAVSLMRLSRIFTNSGNLQGAAQFQQNVAIIQAGLMQISQRVPIAGEYSKRVEDIMATERRSTGMPTGHGGGRR